MKLQTRKKIASKEEAIADKKIASKEEAIADKKPAWPSAYLAAAAGLVVQAASAPSDATSDEYVAEAVANLVAYLEWRS